MVRRFLIAETGGGSFNLRTLPPGLQKNPLPYEAVINLPPPPLGTERYFVNKDVVFLEKATCVILGILTDVITK